MSLMLSTKSAKMFYDGNQDTKIGRKEPVQKAYQMFFFSFLVQIPSKQWNTRWDALQTSSISQVPPGPKLNVLYRIATLWKSA